MKAKDYAIYGYFAYHCKGMLDKAIYVGFNFHRYIQSIKRLAKRHETYCVWLCNGYKYNVDNSHPYAENYRYGQEQADRDISKAEDKIEELLETCRQYGIPIKAEFQRDPRGATVKLFLNVAPAGQDHVYRDITDVMYL